MKNIITVKHDGKFSVFTAMRVSIPFNTGTRQHKQAKGKGAYTRKKKFEKPIDLVS